MKVYSPVSSLSLGEPSLGLMRFVRTCSLKHMNNYTFSREHTQNASSLRDFVYGCTYVAKTGVESDYLANSRNMWV